VRDLLLAPGARPPDLDLVIEGDLERFVEQLAIRLGATRVVRSRFLTCELDLPGGERVDVARARHERYVAPAALPSVEPAAIEQDLVRRDFTMNSLAIRLLPSPGDAGISGTLIDPSGGLADLERRSLRVHHERSFVDDPTRIFRGIDFEARLGLRFDPASERLARDLEARRSLERLSGARLRAALRRAFGNGRTAARALDRAAELGLLSAIHPDLGWSAGKRGTFETIATGLPETEVEAVNGTERVFLLAIALLSLEARLEARREVASRLDLDADSRALLVDGLERLAALRVTSESRPSSVHRSLARMGELELALVAARGPVEAAWVERERTEMRPLRLAIDGNVLLDRGVASGPAIRRALARTLEARLDGSIAPAGELDFALAVAARGEEA
jgi:tRNA nucleotidyltransferase (CCA-adding enzyme)